MAKKEKTNSNISFFKTVGNIISWTMLVLLLLVAGFLLYYIISTQLYAAKGEKFAPKFSLYTIISPSMTPNINVYDIIIDERVDDYESLEVGDVITFISTSSISNGMTITHRIVDVIETDEGTKYKTKGDNNLTADYALVTQDKIIGKVKFRIPQLGRIQFFLSSKGGWLLVILIPALIIILGDVLKLIKLLDIKKRVKKIEYEDTEEEITSQEQLVEEHRKQEELKRKLQNKNNRNKYRRNKYEPDGFIKPSKETHISVDRDDELSRTQAINLNALEELRNVVLNEDDKELYDESMIIKESSDEFVDNYIVENAEETEEYSDIFEQFIKENEDQTTTDDNNIFKSIIDSYDEPAEQEIFDSQSVEEKAEPVKNLFIFDAEDEEIELPKLIQTREEEIPDDLDLPIISANKESSKDDAIEITKEIELSFEKVVDIDAANPKEKNEKIKVVGALKKDKDK